MIGSASYLRVAIGSLLDKKAHAAWMKLQREAEA